MCEARNLYVDLRYINERTIRGNKVVLKDGEIGGYCDLDKPMLGRETAVKRDLSSWYVNDVKNVFRRELLFNFSLCTQTQKLSVFKILMFLATNPIFEELFLRN